MEKVAPSQHSLTKKLLLGIALIGVAIILLSLGIRLAVIRLENRAEIQRHLDSVARLIAPQLIQTLASEDNNQALNFIERLVEKENLYAVKLRLSAGNNSELHEAYHREGKQFFWASELSTQYRYPHTRGVAQIEMHAREPLFSSTTLRKLAAHVVLASAMVAILTLAILFLLQQAVFRNVRKIVNYLLTRDEANLSEALALPRKKNARAPADEFDLVVKAIETMRHTLIRENEQKQAIAQALREEKEQRLETRRLIKEAKAANRAKSKFIATMSHEIRTPLNGVVGMVEMLRDTPLNSNQKHYLDVLCRSGESLLEIINDILDYSKIESGRMLLERINFDLEDLIENCFKLFSATANKREIELISSIAPQTPTKLVGDPTRLRQIIVNLVGNAFKFTDAGYVMLEVQAKTQQAGDNRLLFSIADSGIGISENDQRHLFEAFRQADSSTTRKFGGSGLGLAICKQLAELMDGEIGIESERGVGSTFWFTARFAIDQEALYAAPPSCSLALSGKQLLTVNLSAAMLNGLRLHAPSWNLQLDSTQTMDATQRLENSHLPYDFILIDHKANNANDGFALAKKIRHIGAYRTTPILMLTNQQASSFSQSQLFAVTSIVPRPIAIQSLKNVLISQGYGTQLNPLMPQSSFKPSHSTLSVLVAEDNPVNRLVIEGLLGKFEIKPDFAENGLEAVDKFFAHDANYDLILMDCEMPELDGFDATRRIREEEKNRALAATPIIALTAHVEASHRQQVFNCGMNHFLSKPVTLEKLSEALNTVGITS